MFPKVINKTKKQIVDVFKKVSGSVNKADNDGAWTRANGHRGGNDVTDQPARNFRGGFVIVTQPSATAQDSPG